MAQSQVERVSRASGVRFDSRIDDINNTLFNSVEKRILMASMKVHEVLVDQMLVGNRRGKTYPFGSTTYTASAPNEPPASRSGDLRTSYRYEVKGNGWNAIGLVGTPLPYALRLEKGFVGLDKKGRRYNQAPRPHLKKAKDKAKKDIERIFTGLI